MEEFNYLNQRTTNINIRISPALKTQLINQGAKQGLNLSDYIMHLLIVEMSGGNVPKYSEEEYEALVKETKTNKERYEIYDKIDANFEKHVGQTMIINGKIIQIEKSTDVLKNIVHSLKFNVI